MTWTLRSIVVAAAAAGLGVTALSARPQTPQPPPSQQPPTPPQQPSEVSTVISGDAGAAPRLAVPDFIPLSPDAETDRIAKAIAQVLFDDLNFEREFALIPRDTYSTIPVPKSFGEVALDRWRELNADGVVIGTVQKSGAGIHVEIRVFNVKAGPSAAGFGKAYDGSAANPRIYAHTFSDELHQQQRALRGVARTKLTFNSDRDGERMTGTVENRGVKEIYIADYDGANQRRVTTNRTLNVFSTWSPDGRSIAYTSYRRGPPNIFISNIFQGTMEELTKGEGNAELYVVNRDGSNLRRLTNHPASDMSPTWSPSGTQIAFTSDRTGSPQVWSIGADGLGLRKITSEGYADRATWSPAPYNEIAYASRTGPGFDIKVIDLASGQVRQLTFGEGTNESPAWVPNGRHLAFTSTRAGKVQVFVIARDGKNPTQITNVGNNYQPDWSK